MKELIQKLLSNYKRREEELIPLLQEIQRNFGYLSPETISYVSKHLKISENRIYGVATFYSQFRFNPPGRHSIRVCLGTACHVKGGQILLDMLERELEIHSRQTTPDERFDLDNVACLGCCALSPVVQIDEEIHSRITVNALQQILELYE